MTYVIIPLTRDDDGIAGLHIFVIWWNNRLFAFEYSFGIRASFLNLERACRIGLGPGCNIVISDSYPQ